METKKRKSPEISLKLEIIADYNIKATPSELSRKYGLAASHISTIVKNQEAIKQTSESTRDIKKAKRLREPEYKEVEKYLDMWFRNTKAHSSITIDGPMIQAQALKIATMLKEKDFKASPGWLTNFLKRHNISYKKCIGEAGLVDKLASKKYQNTLIELIRDYSPYDICKLTRRPSCIEQHLHTRLNIKEQQQIISKFKRQDYQSYSVPTCQVKIE